MHILRNGIAAPYRLADALLPPELRELPGGEAVRARILNRSCVVAVLLLLPFLYIHLVARGPGDALFLLVLAAAAVAGFTPVLLRVSRSLQASGLFLMTVESVILAVFIVHDGGFRSPGLLWLPILPLFTVLFAGRRYGIGNAVVLVVFLAWLYLAHVRGFLPERAADDASIYLVYFLSAVAVLLQLIVIALLYLVWQRVVQSELRRANRAKSLFLSGMSHELRTPLNAIIGFAEVLEREYAGALTPQQKESVGYIGSAGRHLLGLVNDILDLAKIEAQKLELELAPMHLKPLLQSSAAMFQQELESRQLRLAQHYDAQIAQAVVLGDERRLRQVLYNLLSNALKFTPEGGEIVLEGAVQDTMATIIVRDTGIGIHPSHLEKVFQRFHQAHDRQAWIRPGTGLGLALTQELVQRHGGTIRAESAGEGKGSTFIVTLPLLPPVRP